MTMDPTSIVLAPQLIFVDALFLLLAVGIGLWFRSSVKQEKAGMDRRIQALETQQESLEKICERLQSACRTLERLEVANSHDATEAAMRVLEEAAAKAPVVQTAMPSVTDPTAVQPVRQRPVEAVPSRHALPSSALEGDAKSREREEMADRSRLAYR